MRISLINQIAPMGAFVSSLRPRLSMLDPPLRCARHSPLDPPTRRSDSIKKASLTPASRLADESGSGLRAV